MILNLLYERYASFSLVAYREYECLAIYDRRFLLKLVKNCIHEHGHHYKDTVNKPL